MAELKTKPTAASVDAYIKRISDETRRQDCMTLVRIMKQVTRTEPKMWGPSMVGFGNYHYKYPSGHEGDCFIAGFASRKPDLTVYLMPGFERNAELMGKLGKHKKGKSCLYIKRLSDIDQKVLKELVTASVKHMRTKGLTSSAASLE